MQTAISDVQFTFWKYSDGDIFTALPDCASLLISFTNGMEYGDNPISKNTEARTVIYKLENRRSCKKFTVILTQVAKRINVEGQYGWKNRLIIQL